MTEEARKEWQGRAYVIFDPKREPIFFATLEEAEKCVSWNYGSTLYARSDRWTFTEKSASLSPGDLVRLKSGGPQMVIESIDKTLADCAWFDGSGEHSSCFQLCALELVRKEHAEF